MVSPSYQATIDQREALEHRAKSEVCTEGHNLIVAYVNGEYVLRCKCGVNPQTTVRSRRSLYSEFRKGQLTGAIERMTLEKQLIKRISRAWLDGKDTSKLEADLERLQKIMSGVKETELTTQMTVKEWSLEQLETIRHQLVADKPANRLTDAEFQLYLAVCRRTALDPFARQIYAVKYGGTDPKMVIIVGIDGLRLIAQRSDAYAGQDDPIYGDTVGGFPESCTVTVYKIVQGVRCPFTATVFWKEMAVENGDLKSMYKKFPHQQMAVRAESHAIRKGFAMETMGLTFSEETIPTPSGQVQKQTGEIIEGTSRPVQDNPIPELDYLVICPVHGEDFYKRGKMPTPGHHLTDGTICNRPKVIADMLKESREEAGITPEDFTAWTKATYNVPPSGLTDEQRCWAINYCRKTFAPVEAVEYVPDPAEPEDGDSQPALA